MKGRVKEFVAACDTCQRNKTLSMKPSGLLQPLPVPANIWEDLSMDFIGGLPKTKKGDTILVVVDRLSKAGHFMCLSHPYTAKEVALIFCKEIVRLNGIPKSIVSDRDQIFLSQFWSELFRLSQTSLKYSSAYHPQSDGQTEVVNRCVETYLRCFCSRQPKDWPHWLCWAEFWYNTTYHSSAKMTPFKVVYGRDPPTLIRWDSLGSKVEEVDAYLQERDRVLDELKSNLVGAQDKMKKFADLHRREVEFQVGEKAFLKIQPYRFKRLAKRPNEKISPRFYGPFPVLEKIGQVAYRLELLSNTKVHSVFHVSQLKKVIGPLQHSQPLPSCLEEDWELKLSPEELLDCRYSSQGYLQVLIKWKALPACENTWEDYEEMVTHFSDFHLEDKVRMKGGGVDKPLTKRVYVSRRRAGHREAVLKRLLCKEDSDWEKLMTRVVLRENPGTFCYGNAACEGVTRGGQGTKEFGGKVISSADVGCSGHQYPEFKLP